VIPTTTSAPCQTLSPPSPSAVPDRGQVGAVERPPCEVEERQRDRPDGEAADEPTHEADRPEEREAEGGRSEDERPQPLRLEAEELVRQGSGGSRDDEQLERRPADSLEHVDPRREERAALTERRAHERHAGDARVRSDHPATASIAFPIRQPTTIATSAAGSESAGTRIAPGDDDEERDAEVAP
jgi:hypothetical protein